MRGFRIGSGLLNVGAYTKSTIKGIHAVAKTISIVSAQEPESLRISIFHQRILFEIARALGLQLLPFIDIDRLFRRRDA